MIGSEIRMSPKPGQWDCSPGLGRPSWGWAALCPWWLLTVRPQLAQRWIGNKVEGTGDASLIIMFWELSPAITQTNIYPHFPLMWVHQFPLPPLSQLALNFCRLPMKGSPLLEKFLNRSDERSLDFSPIMNVKWYNLYPLQPISKPTTQTHN